MNTAQSLANNIIIIGPPAAGKSTLGRKLSERMNLPFFDVDREIEAFLGVSIDTVFAKEGEEGFRKRESDMLRKLLGENEESIIATGGGSVLLHENRALIGEQLLVIYVDVRLSTQIRRVSRDSRRPLLSQHNVREKLIEQREIRTPIYESLADLTVQCDAMSIGKIVKLVQEKLNR